MQAHAGHIPQRAAAAQQLAILPAEVPAAQRPDFIPELASLPSRQARSPEGPRQSHSAEGRLAIAAAAATASLPTTAAVIPERSIAGPSSELAPQPEQQPAPVEGPAAIPSVSGFDVIAAKAPLLQVDRMQTQSKYQAALLRLRQEPGWLGSAPAERQEAFEALWGQFSIKQWQERTAAQVRAHRDSGPGLWG